MSQEPPTNPYIGPRAFEEREGIYFFGREQELEEIFHLLLARRLLLLHSPSGAGKSSLIHARLIPRMRDEGFTVYPPVRLNTAALAGGNRFTQATMISLDEDRPAEEQFTPQQLATMSLQDYFAQRSDPAGEELLIFDQFEEVLSFDPTDHAAKEEFFNQLGAVLDVPHRWALFAMREDYLGALKPYLRPIPTRLAATYRLALLNPEQARQAIQGPAQLCGGRVDDIAAQQLVDDLRQTTVQQADGSSAILLGQSIEPVQLQVVCYRLWERQPSGVITLDDVVLAGSVDTALRDYYASQVAAAAAATGVRERVVRDWIDRQLITEAGLRSQVLRGHETTNGLANEIISYMVNAHLLRAEERRGATWFELAHDRLIGPVRQDNNAWFQLNLTTLQRQARLWQEANRSPDLLLLGEALNEAEAQEADLNDDERAFLEACRNARRLAQREQRQHRRIRRLAWILALVSLIAVILMALSVDLYRRTNLALQQAEQLLQINEAQRLAFVAQSQLPVNAELGVLMAIEANAAHANPVSEQTLRMALEAVPWRITPLLGHDGAVNHVASNHDHTAMLTASEDQTARLWDAEGQLVTTLVGHSAAVTSVAFEPDGTNILTASRDGTARLWDREGKLLVTLSGHSAAVRSATFSPNGNRILTASDDRTVRLWDTRGRLLSVISGHSGLVNSAVFRPDGMRILTASSDRTARVWNIRGDLLFTLEGHDASVNSAIYSSAGHTILTAASDGTARLWDAEGNPLSTRISYPEPLNSATFSFDDQVILTAANDGMVQMWNEYGYPLGRLDGHTNSVKQAMFVGFGARILTASADGSARIWDAQHEILPTIVGHSGAINNAVYSPDGKRILTASWDRTAMLWDRQGNLIAVLRGHTGMINQALFSPNGQRILTASADGTARLWDSEGRLLATLVGHRASIEDATFTPDSQRILTVSRDKTLRVWDAQVGEASTMIEVPSLPTSIAISSDGRRLLTTSWDRSVRLWHSSGELLRTFAAHEGLVHSAVFHPFNNEIMTASQDGRVRFWSEDGELRETMLLHNDAVNSAVYSPDGRYILTASSDKTARLWDEHVHLLTTLSDHHDALTNATFSADGTRILTASRDGTVRQYLVLSADLRRVAACRVGRELSAEEQELYEVAEPLLFTFAQRQCPPVFSWEESDR